MGLIFIGSYGENAGIVEDGGSGGGGTEGNEGVVEEV